VSMVSDPASGDGLVPTARPSDVPPPATRPPEVPPPAASRVSGPPVLRVLAATTWVGLVLGLLVGGVGGRLAMRALFLTSDPRVRGMVSDDGFPIGRFDVGATLNLLLVGTVLGVLGAFVYLGVRPFLLGPTWLRRLGCAIGAGAVVGSMLVHVDGVDFTRLGPRWFAIGLFVALPALFGVLVASTLERMLRPGSWFLTAPPGRALLPLGVLAFPPLLVLVGPPVAVVLGVRWLAASRSGVQRVVEHPVPRNAVRAAWLAVALVGVWTLTSDAVVLLGG
jgi:hypothetical protein